jgi:hypothetical protein
MVPGAGKYDIRLCLLERLSAPQARNASSGDLRRTRHQAVGEEALIVLEAGFRFLAQQPDRLRSRTAAVGRGRLLFIQQKRESVGSPSFDSNRTSIWLGGSVRQAVPTRNRGDDDV